MERIKLPLVKKIDQGTIIIICSSQKAKKFFFLTSLQGSSERDKEYALIREALNKKKGSFLMKGKVEDAFNVLNTIIEGVEDSVTLELESIFARM